MSFSFGQPTRPRRPNLTPMIDVVFLLLVFFMLASRFGTDMILPLDLAGSGAGGYSGPPRLVDIRPDGLALNGVPIAEAELASRLSTLASTPQDAIVLRARDGAELQRVIDAMELLRAGGFEQFVMVE